MARGRVSSHLGYSVVGWGRGSSPGVYRRTSLVLWKGVIVFPYLVRETAPSRGLFPLYLIEVIAIREINPLVRG